MMVSGEMCLPIVAAFPYLAFSQVGYYKQKGPSGVWKPLGRITNLQQPLTLAMGYFHNVCNLSGSTISQCHGNRMGGMKRIFF